MDGVVSKIASMEISPTHSGGKTGGAGRQSSKKAGKAPSTGKKSDVQCIQESNIITGTNKDEEMLDRREETRHVCSIDADRLKGIRRDLTRNRSLKWVGSVNAIDRNFITDSWLILIPGICLVVA